LKPLDSLRGLAACGVAFFWHYQHFAPQHGTPFANVGYWLHHYGYTLVDFFFVLSGFVMCYVYETSISTRRTTLGRFAWLRASRLYPLHLATLVFVTLVLVCRHALSLGNFVYQNNDAYNFALNVFFIQGDGLERGQTFNGPTWSISCEIVAYLLFFVITRLFARKNIRLMAYAFMIVLGVVVMLTGLKLPLLDANLARVYIGFFAGCLVRAVYDRVRVSRQSGPIWAAVWVSLAVLVTVASIWGNNVLGANSAWKVTYAVVLFPLVIWAGLSFSPVIKVLSWRPLVFLGDASYAIYLCHFPIQMVIVTLDQSLGLHINYSSYWFYALYVVVTLAVASVVHVRFEKPMQTMLRGVMARWVARNSSRAPSAVGVPKVSSSAVRAGG